jgi:hypothetical protein
MSIPILAQFDPNCNIIIETNASNYISTRILSQYNDNGILYLVAYFSKKHSWAKYNYEIYNKELIAIMHTFEEWRLES